MAPVVGMNFFVAYHPTPEATVNLEFPGDDWVPAMEKIAEKINPNFSDPAKDLRYLEMLKAR